MLSLAYSTNVYDASSILTFLKIYFQIMESMFAIPTCFQYLLDINRSIKKIKGFLDKEEIDYFSKSKFGINQRTIEFETTAKDKKNQDKIERKRPNERNDLKEALLSEFSNIVLNKATRFSNNEEIVNQKQSKWNYEQTNNQNDEDLIWEAKEAKKRKTRQVKLNKPNITIKDDFIDIEIEIKRGDFIMIYMPNKYISKNMIIQTILDTLIRNDSIDHKSIAFLSHRPWLMNTSIKKNILLNKAYNEMKIQNAIEKSQLREVLGKLRDGIEHVVGEAGEGLTLSMKTKVGQCQCIYQDPEIYLFDDVMTCFDNESSDFLIRNTLKNHLKGKTRVFITSSVEHLKYADYIYFVDGSYNILIQGNYDQIKKNEFFLEAKELEENINFETQYHGSQSGSLDDFEHGEESYDSMSSEKRSDQIPSKKSLDGADNNDTSSIDLNPNTGNGFLLVKTKTQDQIIPPNKIGVSGGSGLYGNKAKKNRLFRSLLGGSKKNDMLYPDWIHDDANYAEPMDNIDYNIDYEEVGYEHNKFVNEFFNQEGLKRSVPRSVFIKFFKAMGGFFIILIIYCITQYASQAEFYSYLYQLYSSDSGNLDKSSDNLIIFCLISTNCVQMSLFRNSICMICSIRLSKKTFNTMLYHFIHSKVDEFIDRVSQSNIHNRFQNDMDRIDRSIMMNFSSFMMMLGFVLSEYVAVIYSTHYLLVCTIILLIIIQVIFQIYYMNIKREITRLVTLTQQPISSLVSDTVKGQYSIRVMNLQPYLKDKLNLITNEASKNHILNVALDSWFGMRIALMHLLLIQFPAYSIIVIYYKMNIEIYYQAFLMFVTTGTVNHTIFVVKNFSLFESSMKSYEKLTYFEKIKPEENYFDFKKGMNGDVKLEEELENNKNVGVGAEHISPKGFVFSEIKFEQVSSCYIDSSVNIIKGVSFVMKSKEKIGILGPKGSGKTSLIKLLPQIQLLNNGRISIDKSDISKLDLKFLRRQMIYLTKDTNLFEGTLRDNMDPLFLVKDPAQHKILALLDFSNESFQEHGLQMRIDPEGSNQTREEKVLINFSRALVRKAKLIILDEITAGVDERTEKLILKIVYERLKDSMLIFVGHKPSVIENCQKIMVLNNGKIVEFGEPNLQLRNAESYYTKQVNFENQKREYEEAEEKKRQAQEDDTRQQLDKGEVKRNRRNPVE